MRPPRAWSVRVPGRAQRRLIAAVASLAVLLPVGGLLWAGVRARDAVVERVLVGQAATAQAVAVQLGLAWEAGLSDARSAPGRSSLQDGLSGGNAAVVDRELVNVFAAGPFVSVAAYGPTGRLVTAVGIAPTALTGPSDVETVGRPLVDGRDATAAVLEPVLAGGRQVGTVRLQLSLRLLLPDLDGLRYGRTGTTSVVDSSGLFLLAADDSSRGQKLLTAPALALAAGHRAGSVQVYSPRSHTRVVSNYAPVRGTAFGVFTRQHESDAFGAADRLERELRVAALAGLLLGLTMLAIGAHLLRRYRQRLDARDAELRDVFARSNDIIARYDSDRRCVFTSPAVYDVLGWTPAERVGRDIVDLLRPDDLAQFIAERPARDHRDSDRRTMRVRHRDGHDVWVEVATAVERAADGSPVAYNTVTRDVTARHQAEAELAGARDAAVAASASKSVFLANTSHELRTPLNGVLGLTELLLATDLDDQQREYARTVLGSGRNLLVILDDILDLAKIEAGKVTLESVPFALVEVVRSALAPFRALTEGKGIALEVDLDADLPVWVRGDPTRFGQVLKNLVSNAVKFTSAGAVRVRVRPADGPDLVEVSVEDTGIGIAAGALGQLFEAFTQADSGTTRRYGGTGLGLAVSRQLAELQGGSLTVTSTIGVGSTFTVVLPLPGEDAPVADPEVVAPAGPGPRLRVLVAEDNAVNQLVARTMLTELGHEVHVVENGLAAVEAVLGDGLPYDVVLMDCQMPVLDGYAATRLIRNGDRPGRRTAVVGLTASAMAAERDQGLAAGMDRYLAKPISMQDLAAALADVCRLRAAVPVPAG